MSGISKDGGTARHFPSGALYLVPAALLALILFISVKIESSFVFPFPPFNKLIFNIADEFSALTSYDRPLGSEGGYRDLGGVLIGMRRLTADIAWISVLQYYGSHEHHEEGHSHDFAGGEYPALKKMILRVTRLDPSFQYAYLYGAGALTFGTDRPEEAMELLREGIFYNPTYWRFRLYVGAILYKKQGQFGNMIALLEDAIRYPDCPTMVKSILANIYKEKGDYARALKIWLEVLDNKSSDNWYKIQAEKQIGELGKKLGNSD